MIKVIMASALAIVLTACGGGGSDTPVTQVDNSQPKTEYINFNFETVFQQRVPGAGLTSMFIDSKTKIISVSDEPYWQVFAPVDKRFSATVTHAREQGYRAMAIFTPYALDVKSHTYLSQAYPAAGFQMITREKMIEMAQQLDIVAIDPYYFGDHLMTVEQLVSFSKEWLDIIHGMGKPAMVVVGAMKTGDQKKIESLTAQLASMGFDYITDFTAYDSGYPSSINWDAVPTIKANIGNVKPYKMQAPTPAPKVGEWSCVNGQPTYHNFDGRDDYAAITDVKGDPFAETLGSGNRVVQLPQAKAPITCPV